MFLFLPGLEVWNRNFFAKVTRLLHENDGKYFIQSNLHCYSHIFPTSPEGDECHANKTVRLLNQTSYPAILIHFRTKWSVVQRERGPVMRNDGNLTEPSLEDKRHALVFPNWPSAKLDTAQHWPSIAKNLPKIGCQYRVVAGMIIPVCTWLPILVQTLAANTCFRYSNRPMLCRILVFSLPEWFTVVKVRHGAVMSHPWPGLWLFYFLNWIPK